MSTNGGITKMKPNAAAPEIEVIEPQAIVPSEIPMSLSRPPEIVLAEAQKAAKALAEVLYNKKKKIVFGGEQYLEFEDWQLLGRFYSVSAKVNTTAYVEYGEVHGFEASASAVMNPGGQVISSAEALCLDDETNWAHKPMYQLRSMAQTRAAAKALRNCLSWIVVLAGYKATPAEEMSEVSTGREPIKQPTRFSSRPSAVSEPAPEAESTPESEPESRKISTKQRGMFWAKVHQYKWTDDEAKALIRRYGVEKTDDLLASDFSAILKELEQGAGA